MTEAPLNVLVVSASGRRAGSVSRNLTSDLVAALADKGRKLTIVERDLAEGAPFVDEDWIGANFTPPENRSADQSATLSYSDGLVDELKAADLIVIATPVYNFGIPASLKAWIDQVARARVTFKYTENGPVGLLENKRAIIVAASGGTEVGSAIDFATPYLRHILSFIGVTDVDIVAADRLMMDAETSLARAQKQISAAVQKTAGFARRAA